MTVNEVRQWMSMNEVWTHLMEDPYYGVEPGLITAEEFLVRFQQSKIWSKSTKQGQDKLGRRIWENLNCPLCNKKKGWTHIELPWVVFCKYCDKSFSVQDYVQVRELRTNHHTLNILENKKEFEKYRIPHPFDDSPQLRLLHIWHGLDGLPLYKKNNQDAYKKIESYGPDYINLIENTDFQLGKVYFNRDDFEDFLLSQKYPLPSFWFPNNPVSTEFFSQKNFVDDDFILIKRLKKINAEIQEWKNMRAETVAEKEQKDKKLDLLFQEYRTVWSQLSVHMNQSLTEKEEKAIICHLVKKSQEKLNNGRYNFSNENAGSLILDASGKTFARRAKDGKKLKENKSLDTTRFEQQVEDYITKLTKPQI